MNVGVLGYGMNAGRKALWLVCSGFGVIGVYISNEFMFILSERASEQYFQCQSLDQMQKKRKSGDLVYKLFVWMIFFKLSMYERKKESASERARRPSIPSIHSMYAVVQP